MTSPPKIGSSFSCSEISTSPICACPVCTARLMSGALNSEAPGWTVMVSLPPVASATSLANSDRFSLCGLLAGYAAGRSHLVCAIAGVVNAAKASPAASRSDRFIICRLIRLDTTEREIRNLSLADSATSSTRRESHVRQHQHDLRELGDDEHGDEQQDEERESRLGDRQRVAAAHVLQDEQVEADRRRHLRHLDMDAE